MTSIHSRGFINTVTFHLCMTFTSFFAYHIVLTSCSILKNMHVCMYLSIYQSINLSIYPVLRCVLSNIRCYMQCIPLDGPHAFHCVLSNTRCCMQSIYPSLGRMMRFSFTMMYELTRVFKDTRIRAADVVLIILHLCNLITLIHLCNLITLIHPCYLTLLVTTYVHSQSDSLI